MSDESLNEQKTYDECMSLGGERRCRVGGVLRLNLGELFFSPPLVVDANVTFQVMSFVGSRVGCFFGPFVYSRDLG